jgi:hypothetical protein
VKLFEFFSRAQESKVNRKNLINGKYSAAAAVAAVRAEGLITFSSPQVGAAERRRGRQPACAEGGGERQGKESLHVLHN